MTAAKTLRASCLALTAVAASLVGVSSAAAVVVPAPAWAPIAVSGPTNLPPEGEGTIALYVQNVGGLTSSASEPITVTDVLPPGLTTAGTPTSGGGEGVPWNCTPGSGQSTIVCTTTQVVGPGLTPASINVAVDDGPATIEPETNVVTASGGGAAGPATYEEPVTISSTPAKPGAQTFTAGAYSADGSLNAQAGSHPYSGTAAVFANTVLAPNGQVVPAGDPRTIAVALPPGFLGNPLATPRCQEGRRDPECPIDTQVGVAAPIVSAFGSGGSAASIHAVRAPVGYPAKFTFTSGEQINVLARLRTDEDYGATVESPNTPQILPVYGVFFTIWGTPGDSSHDGQRCEIVETHGGCGPSDAGSTALITQPTDCALQGVQPPVVGLEFDTWQTAGRFEHQQFPTPAVTGCNQLQFESNFTFQPSEAASADSPSGFTTNLTVPPGGLTDPEKLAVPEQKKVVVHLPDGVVFNPSAAGGLGACSEAQIGLKGAHFAMPNPIRFDKNPNKCPESSKIGTIKLKTPLLEETLQGALYLARQGENPFGSLFAVYLVIENPRNGIFIKLPGDTEPDPSTGQITVTFDDLPQLPFESLKLSLKGGSRSPLATPTTCGTYTTTTLSTSWSAPESGPPFETKDNFTIDRAPTGSACANTPAQRPFTPSLHAGSSNANAGAFTPFTLRLTRNDGEQEFGSLEVSAPPGFIGVLTGVPFCPEAAIKTAEANSGSAERQSPSCPTTSELGTLTAGVGVGNDPYHASGKAYLAGPYKGAPVSIVFMAPALAGPFDLGDVVVRAAIYVNPETSQITIKTDPIPQILDGVPLHVRSIEANIDRPNFGLNPTSCEKFSVATTVHGASGAVFSPSDPFQVGGCAGLTFTPKFAVSTSGKTSKASGASLAVKLTYPPGSREANIAKVKVELPKQLPSRLTTLQKACTAAVFDANPAGCPAESVIGRAKAITPVLPVPLVGPVYFVSHGGEAFPSLIVVLQGYGITVDLVGTTFISKTGITSSTFKTVPDVPVGSFELTLPEGKYSALAANGNLCTSKPAMPTEFVAQNGKQIHESTKIAVTGCPKVKKAKLTRAQKLKAALKACKQEKPKSRRAKCERQARKKYGPIRKKSKKK